jgi:cellulose synthase (UDP-forming)
MSVRPLTRRRVGFAAYLALTTAYLGWRALFSINPDAPAYAWSFFALEVYACICSIAFYATILERRRRASPPPLPGFEVDVFICTYNEAVPLLRQTVRRAMAMDYPHRTWLLDDGNRPQVHALANELGCGYFARTRNEHFKAGNLNHALSKTRGDLVVVLDADHLVRSEFLERLVGYFADLQVALVQTPQVFYNVDSFQHHLDAHRDRLWHEGAIFHHAIQPGADRWNAAFFVGTGAILRRSALERIGGFATGSVTEDAFTCMRLHAAGFQSVYHDEPLAYLMAPESLSQYLGQRLRWGQGSMQILRLENPLWRPGLTLPQRFVYFMALSSFAQALVHLAYYLAPAIFLLGGPAPLRASRVLQLAPILAHVLVDLVTFRLFLGPLGRPLLSECYKFLNVYAYLKSLTGLFRSRRLRFQVTTKGRDGRPRLSLLFPQGALLFVNAAAVAAGTIRLFVEDSDLGGRLGIAVAMGFAAMFVVIGTTALLFAHERLATRTEYAFPDHLPAEIEGSAAPAIVLRLNDAEVHALSNEPQARFAAGAPIRLRVALGRGGRVDLSGRVAATTPAGSGRTVLSVTLEPLDDPARDALLDRLCEHAIPNLVNPLVAAWSDGEVGPSGSGAEAAPDYYLPLRPNVL